LFLTTTLGLAYFGNLRSAPASGSVLENATLPAVDQPAAQQIPATTGDVPAAASAAVPPVPAEPATGAAQIPAK
jgi:preprotein translocase subunit SecG